MIELMNPVIRLMKTVLFALGVVLALGAFMAAGAEMAAQAVDRSIGWLPGTLTVWQALSPETFDAMRPALGDGGMAWLLRAPPWMLLGAPGLALIIAFRRRGSDSLDDYEAGLFLYDELAERSSAETFEQNRDDRDPTAFEDVVPAAAHYAEAFDPDTDPSLGTPTTPSGQHDYLLPLGKADTHNPDAKSKSD